MTKKEVAQTMESVIADVSAKFSQMKWESKEAYGFWLSQTYYFVCHSTRLLALAASRFTIENKELHARFLVHSKEEQGHEFLAARDLQALGYKPGDFPEHASTSALYQSQYFWIDRVEPTAFFGYILGLEGLAVKQCEGIYTETKKNFGERASSFVKVHGGDDPEHLDKAIEMIAKLPPKSLEYIDKNLKQFGWNYSQMLDATLAIEHGETIPKRKAV